ncbi:MAG TPA: exosortase family protein XrtF [Chitinophagaceae bacterium]|jgi:exosortase family protein XrtF|nr:exosortase family protein XrtF [Chitinophagaceae bacterium]
MWKEFKPALRFLLVFVGLYFIGNLVYGVYISYNGNAPDEMTSLIADQSAWLLSNLFGYDVHAVLNASGPTVFLKTGEYDVLNIYEGCNGINVFIVFSAFIIAFNGNNKKSFWFIPLGIFILHLSNLLRIIFLYWTAVNFHRYFYYVHKYIFTGVIYAAVFVLWIIWVYQLNDRKKIITTE